MNLVEQLETYCMRLDAVYDLVPPDVQFCVPTLQKMLTLIQEGADRETVFQHPLLVDELQDNADRLAIYCRDTGSRFTGAQVLRQIAHLLIAAHIRPDH